MTPDRDFEVRTQPAPPPENTHSNVAEGATLEWGTLRVLIRGTCGAGYVGETIRAGLGGNVAKYRQHGYQDRDREPRGGARSEQPRKAPAERTSGPPKWDHALGPRPLNLPGTRDVSRCAQCGTLLESMLAGMGADGKCPKCGFELHSCKQCTYFDPGSRFECMQPVKERVAKKDERNSCELFEIRVTREKETSTPASLRPTSARAAFDNLFKK
jgi:hypothetical protein